MLKVGLILYSVRRTMAEDPMGTVSAVAALGYKNIEVCNHNAAEDSGCGFGIPAETLRAEFDKYGSKVVSAHIFPFERADLEAVIAYNRALGNTRLVIPNGRFSSYDELMRQCEFMNAAGKTCREAGMTLGYHNHTQEFRTIGGKTVLELMMEHTDPDCLSLELDTFWTMRAGVCPVEVMKRFGKRINLLHQKDFAWTSLVPINMLGDDREIREGEAYGTDAESYNARRAKMAEGGEAAEAQRIAESAFTEIGTGIMRIQDIIDAANDCTAAEYIILEQDATRLPSELASVEASMAAFKKFDGISWEG